MVCNGQNVLSFWTVFCPFAPPPPPPINDPENQNFEKMKKKKKKKKPPQYITILHMCTINDNHMCMVPEIWSETNITFCHFGLFFALLHP